MARYQRHTTVDPQKLGDRTVEPALAHLGGQFTRPTDNEEDSVIIAETPKRLLGNQVDLDLDQPRHVEHRRILPPPLVLRCRDAISLSAEEQTCGSASDSGVSMVTGDNSPILKSTPFSGLDKVTPLRLPPPMNMNGEHAKGDAPLRQQYRVPYEEEDSWSDSDSAIGVTYDSSLCPPPPPTPLEGYQHHMLTEVAFNRAFERKMDLERDKAIGRYSHTEQRQRTFNWKDEFYIDKDGHTGVWQEVADEQHRHLVATDAAFSLSSCRWHKSKVGPARRVDGAEESQVPTLKLTDTEGQEWFLDDLFFYSDDGDYEEEDDEAIYD